MFLDKKMKLWNIRENLTKVVPWQKDNLTVTFKKIHNGSSMLSKQLKDKNNLKGHFRSNHNRQKIESIWWDKKK